jgi:hypothetical protein
MLLFRVWTARRGRNVGHIESDCIFCRQRILAIYPFLVAYRRLLIDCLQKSISLAFFKASASFEGANSGGSASD